MNTHLFYPLLLCLASGITQCFLLGCSFLLFWKYNKYQFQRAFAVVLLILSIGFFNNFLVLAFSESPIAVFINTLLVLYDYLIVGGYMIFSITLVFPGRYRAWQLALLEIPYVVALLLYAFTQNTLIYFAVQLFTLVLSTVLLIWLERSIKRHDALLRDNVGNIEYFDLRWGAILIALLFVVQLVWAVESFSQQNWFSAPSADGNLLFDTLWCIITVVYVLIILRKIIQQQVFTVPPQDDDVDTTAAPSSDEYYKMLKNSDIDALIKEKKYYLDTALTLQKLATHLGTNRQYLSNYINREKGKTFYEYINDFRMEEAKGMLDSMDSEHQRSMEDIAALAGFKSYSTFLRSFVKKYGKTPSKYLGS